MHTGYPKAQEPIFLLEVDVPFGTVKTEVVQFLLKTLAFMEQRKIKKIRLLAFEGH